MKTYAKIMPKKKKKEENKNPFGMKIMPQELMFLVMVDELSNSDISKHEAIYQMLYTDVLDVLLTRSYKNDIIEQRRIQEELKIKHRR